MSNDLTIKLGLDAAGLPQPVAAVNAAIGSIGKTGEISARQTAAAMRTLPAQLTDVATQLAGGGNPLLILLQQGGQIKDSFGGIGPAISGIAAAITPTAVAVGGLAATLGVFGLAAYQAAQQDAELRSSIALTGNAAGLTGARFEALALHVAEGSRQTVGGARDIVMALAQSGTVSNSVLATTAQAVARFADMSGQDATKVAADFAKMRDGVAKWAAEHNRSWNLITAEEYRAIRSLEERKKIDEAMLLVNTKIIARADEHQASLSKTTRLLDEGAKSWSAWWAAARGLVGPETTLAKLQAVRKQIAEITKDGEPGNITYSAGRVQALRLQAQMLAEQYKQEEMTADARSRAAVKESKAIDEERKNEGKAGKGSKRDKLDPAVNFDILDSKDARARLLEAQQLEDARVDSFFEEQLQRQDERDAKRLGLQDDYLQSLRDGNRRAAAELLQDERARGEALIALDIQTAERRFQAQNLEGTARLEALRELDKLNDQRYAQLNADLQKTADDAGKATYGSVRNALAAAFRDTKSPIKAFGNALASEIFSRATSSLADAIATAAVGKNGSGGLIGDLVGLLSGISGGGLSIPDGDGGAGGIGVGRTDGEVGLPTRGGMATGTNFVPRNMIAKLHVGEAVVPARYNPAAGGVGGGTFHFSQTFHIDARSDQAQVAQMVYGAVQEGNAALVEDLQSRGLLPA